MKKFFEPDTVALIGASSNPQHPGYDLFLNLRDCFDTDFYPVNPRVEELDGKKCYPSILEVPAEIDVAVVFIPAKAIPSVLEQCGQKGITRVIIESSGFAETGEDGARLQEHCLSIAQANGIRLWGPNCMGSINVRQMKILSFMKQAWWKGRFIPGSVSLVVQSGMLSAGFLDSILSRTPFGLSKIASVGNKMDVDETDILEYLVNDPQTDVIAMYQESINQGRRFFELCRDTDKPIVMLKAGRSESGAKAATSHTASLAQNDAIVDGALRQAGVIRVNDMNDLLNTARHLSLTPPVKRQTDSRIAILTFSGGAGVVATDIGSDCKVGLAGFSEATTAELAKIFPDWMAPANPLDVYPAVEQHGPTYVYNYCMEKALNDPGVDALFLHLYSAYLDMGEHAFNDVAELSRKLDKPVVAWMMGDAGACEKYREKLEAVGFPVFDEINKAVHFLSAILKN